LKTLGLVSVRTARERQTGATLCDLADARLSQHPIDITPLPMARAPRLDG